MEGGTVAKVESVKVEEKCGLDMSSYEDLPRPSVGGSGNGGGDCNGDGKDDYVFVNGSDAASDDHGERDGNEELNASESNVDSQEKMEGGDAKVSEGDQLGTHSGDRDRVNNEIKVDVGELKIGNGVDVGTESEGKVEGGELVTENGENNSQSEVIVQNGELSVQNGSGNNVEVEVRDSEVVEGNDTTSVSDGLKDGESCIEKGDNCNPSSDGVSTLVLDDDDKGRTPVIVDRGLDARSPDKAEEVQKESRIMEVTPLVPDGYTEEQHNPVEPQKHEDQGNKPETPEIEGGKPMGEDNVQPHVDDIEVRQLEPLDSSVKELKPFEADIQQQSLENAVPEMQSSSSECKSPQLPGSSEPQPVDGEDNVQLHADEVLVREMEPLDSGVKEPKPSDSEADIGYPSLEGEVPEMQPSDSEFKGPHLPGSSDPQPVDDGVKDSLLDDEDNVNQSFDSRHPEQHPKTFETDGEHQSLEGGVTEKHPSDSECKGAHLPESSQSQPVDGESKDLLLEAADTVNQSLDCQQPEQQPKPFEADIRHQSLDGGVSETQPSDSEFKGPHLPESSQPEPVDGEAKESLLDDADTVNQSLDCQQPELQPQSLDGGVLEMEPSDGEFKGSHFPESFQPLLVKGERKESLHDDANNATPPVDCQQRELQPAYGESKELGQIEADAKVKELGDLDEAAGTQVLGSEDSEAVRSELPQSEECEIKGQNATNSITESEEVQELHTSPVQSETEENQGGLVSTALEVERQVTDSTDHVAVSKVESAAEVEKSSTTSGADMQSDMRDEPVGGKENSELIAEVAGGQESSVKEDVHLEQEGEKTGSVNVMDKEISLEDLGLEKTMASEEASRLSKLQASNGEAVEEDGDDLSGVVASESNVSDDLVNHSQAVSESAETSVDAESCLRAEEGDVSIHVDAATDLPVVSDGDNIKEERIVGNPSSVSDNSQICSAGDTSPQPKLESPNGSYHAHDAGTQTRHANGEVDVAKKSNCISNDTLKPKISFGSFECEAPFSHNDVNARPEVLNRSIKLTSSMSQIKPSNGVVILNSEGNKDHHTEYNHDKTCVEDLSVEHVNKNEASASPLQGSGSDAFNGQNLSTEVVRRPFYYLIRVPRYDDEKLREQIRLSEIEVQEKTRSRDSVRVQYQKRKATVNELKYSLQAARAEERAARELMFAKKREIDSAQSLINLAKNAMTVEDFHSQILNMEHKIQHETLNLNEEKKLVREIKQLKNLRDQLYANTQSQQNLQQALDQRVQVEEHLKVLRKEMDALRNNLSKAEQSVKAARKKYDDESILLNELYDQFTSADAIRQKAYEDLLILKKQWSEKNKYFWSYKDDAKAANDLVVAGNKDSLERHCVNQVEKIMELWNNNDEFRKEYVRCNTRSTLRRLRTLDGRSLGPDEEPPLLANFYDDRVTSSAKVNSVTTVSPKEPVVPLFAKHAENNSLKKVMEQKNKTVPAKKMAEATSKNSLAAATSKNSLAAATSKNNVAQSTSKNSVAEATSQNNVAEASGRTEKEEKEERKMTKEEEEVAKKEETLRKEEEAARLREQRRLEEKAKAQEALERKRKLAEKAKLRADFRAQKEAEQKEKEREKRAKKKEKRKGVTSETAESESAVPPESPSVTVREPEVTEKPMTVAKKPQKPSPYAKQIKTTKSIPPPIRNRGKRRMQQWMWVLAAVVGILALFFLGNSNFFRNSRLLSFGPAY